MTILKYIGKKIGGLAISFPVGVNSKAAITHHKVAAPYIELSDSDAELVLELDEKRVKESGARYVEKYNKDGNLVSRDKVYDAPDCPKQFVVADEAEYEAWKKSGGGKPAAKKRHTKGDEPEAAASTDGEAPTEPEAKPKKASKPKKAKE